MEQKPPQIGSKTKPLGGGRKAPKPFEFLVFPLKMASRRGANGGNEPGFLRPAAKSIIHGFL